VLRAKLQAAIDRVEVETDAEIIVLGYGLCSRGTEGVRTSRCRLVIARAHDCITHLLGDKDRYARYVAGRPGTYWYSPGWNKHTDMPGKERHETLHRKYTEEYGEDNAQFLMDTEQHWFKTYNNAVFVISAWATLRRNGGTRNSAPRGSAGTATISAATHRY